MDFYEEKKEKRKLKIVSKYTKSYWSQIEENLHKKNHDRDMDDQYHNFWTSRKNNFIYIKGKQKFILKKNNNVKLVSRDQDWIAAFVM